MSWLERMRGACAAMLMGMPMAVHAAPVEEIRTQSGLSAWLVEDHTLPLLSVRMLFADAGSATDPESKEGRASMVSGLLLEGAGTRDALAFTQALERSAIRFSLNTGLEQFSLSLGTLTDEREQAFSLVSDALCRPRFEAAALQRVRMRMQSALRSLNEDPDYLAGRALMEKLFGTHRYARPEEGTEKSLNAITEADVRAFAQRYLTRKNAIISVAGDITPAEASALLEKHFSCLAPAFQPEISIEKVALPTTPGNVNVSRDMPQHVVSFALPGVARRDPEYMTAFVLNHIIGGGGSLTSRLGKELREKRGLTYGVGTGLQELAAAPLWVGNFSTRAEKTDEALRVLRKELQRLAEQGVEPEELESAKRYLTGSFVLGLDTNAEVAEYLLLMQRYGLGKDYLERRNDLINAVTAEQINAMTKKLLRLTQLQLVTVGPKERTP